MGLVPYAHLDLKMYQAMLEISWITYLYVNIFRTFQVLMMNILMTALIWVGLTSEGYWLDKSLYMRGLEHWWPGLEGIGLELWTLVVLSPD